LRFNTNRRIKRDIKSDVLSRNTSQKVKKLLAEDLNLEPLGSRFKF